MLENLNKSEQLKVKQQEETLDKFYKSLIQVILNYMENGNSFIRITWLKQWALSWWKSNETQNLTFSKSHDNQLKKRNLKLIINY